jgi:hypothetical protein
MTLSRFSGLLGVWVIEEVVSDGTHSMQTCYAIGIALSRFSCFLGAWVIEEVVPDEADSIRTYYAVEMTLFCAVYLLDFMWSWRYYLRTPSRFESTVPWRC